MCTEDCFICNRKTFCQEHPVWLRNQKQAITDKEFKSIYFPRGKEHSSITITSCQKIMKLKNEWRLWIDNKIFIFIVCQKDLSNKNLHSVSLSFDPYYRGILIPQKKIESH